MQSAKQSPMHGTYMGGAKGVLAVNKIRQITPESGMALPLWRSQFLSNVRVFPCYFKPATTLIAVYSR